MGSLLTNIAEMGQPRVVRTGLAPTIDTTWSRLAKGTNHLSSLNATVASDGEFGSEFITTPTFNSDGMNGV